MTNYVPRDLHWVLGKTSKLEGNNFTPRLVSSKIIDRLNWKQEDYLRFLESENRGIIDVGAKSGNTIVEFSRRATTAVYESGKSKTKQRELIRRLRNKIWAIPATSFTHFYMQGLYRENKWNLNNLIYPENSGNSSTFGHDLTKLVNVYMKYADTKSTMNSKDTETWERHYTGIANIRGIEIHGSKQVQDSEIMDMVKRVAQGGFDAAVGNPPYQKEVMDASGRPSVTNIFQDFYYLAWGVADTVSMIFPGGRWMNRQSRLGEASDFILSTANHIYWYPNGDEAGIQKLFTTERISDGVSIVAGKKNNDEFYVNGVEFERPEKGGIIPLTEYGAKIVAKALKKNHVTISSRRFSAAFFKLRSNWTTQNPGKFVPIEEEHNFPKPIKAFLSDDNPTIMAKKVKEYWIDSSSVDWNPERREAYRNWKVTAPSVLKDPSNTRYRVIPKNHIVGESWVILGHFKTKREAENYREYIMSKTVQLLLDESKGGRLKSFGAFVPDLEDYTAKNPLFTPDIKLETEHEYKGLTLDERLYKYFDLSESEIEFLE